MAKKFICSVCGYIHEGNEAPEQCPLCKVSKDKFTEMAEENKALEFVTEHKIGDGKVDNEEIVNVGLNLQFLSLLSQQVSSLEFIPPKISAVGASPITKTFLSITKLLTIREQNDT